MRYSLRVCLSIALAGVLATRSLPAQDEGDNEGPALYRVEVIVFTHADGESDRHPIDAPETRADAIDPAWEAATRDRSGEMSRLPPPLADMADATPQLPPAFVALDDYSPAMNDAWRRLSDSPRFDPVIRLAWHQTAPRNTSTPWVRIHDDTRLPDQPFAGWSLNELEDDAAAVDDIAATSLGDPAYYRLDGRARLYRRQYYHIELDLVWQTPIMRMQPAIADRPLRPASYAIHRLRSSRTVRPNRLEYFDSAWLGAVVRISQWQNPAGQPDEPAPAAVTD